MSIPVALDRIAAVLADFGSGYLVTVGADGTSKIVTIDPTVRAGAIELPPSRGSARNLAANPSASLVFPPGAPHGYTLIVDGTATASGADDPVVFTPAAAVLHRPGRHADGPPAPTGAGEQTGCDNDCRPV